MKKKKINPEEIYEALATPMTRKARTDLYDSVKIPDDGTEAQKAYAENLRLSADNVFIQAWILGVRDDRKNVEEIGRKLAEAAKNKAVLSVLKKDPNSGL